MADDANLTSEDAVLAAALADTDARTAAILRLTGQEWGDATRGAVWAAITTLDSEGQAVTVDTVQGRLWRDGHAANGQASTYHALLAVLGDAARDDPLLPRRVDTHIDNLVEAHRRRRLHDLGENLARYAPTRPADQISDLVARRLAEIDQPTRPLELKYWRDLAGVKRPPREWIIDDLATRGMRIVIVGPEGRGKSWLLRQIGAYAAAGRHPFHPDRPIRPIRWLHADAENDEGTQADFWDRVAPHLPDPEDRAAYWPDNAAGLVLNQPSDRRALELQIARHQPDLVTLGPIYQLWRKAAGESDEDAAAGVMHVVDDLRGRYRCAFVLEHHAPFDREPMRPYGTSVWLRWPETGIGLTPDPDEEHTLTVSRWRGDRIEVDWPGRFRRGKGSAAPWLAEWEGVHY